MAIVKANFVKRGPTTRARAKATIRYIQDRPGREGEKSSRALFGADGAYTREEAHRMIETAPKGTLFYRLVISPDPRREDAERDLDLKDLTIQTMVHLEERLKTNVQFAAVEHSDHTPNRHVHVLALLPRLLNREDFESLRTSATHLSLLQRRIRDLRQERQLSPNLTHSLPSQMTRARKNASRLSFRPRRKRQVTGHTNRQVLHCPRACSESGQVMEWISGRLFKCPGCGVVARKTGLDMQIQEPRTSFSKGL